MVPPFPVLTSVPRCLCSLTTFGPVVHTAHSGPSGANVRRGVWRGERHEGTVKRMHDRDLVGSSFLCLRSRLHSFLSGSWFVPHLTIPHYSLHSWSGLVRSFHSLPILWPLLMIERLGSDESGPDMTDHGGSTQAGTNQEPRERNLWMVDFIMDFMGLFSLHNKIHKSAIHS